MKNVLKGLLAGVVFAWLCSGCSNEEGKVTTFSGSDCKSHLYRPARAVAKLFTVEQSEPYQGLRCISWQYDEEQTFSLDLINFEGACGAEYEGAFQNASSGELNLLVHNPGCQIAMCGYCVYDWSFQVEDVPAEDFVVNVKEDSCPGSDSKKDSYSLPIDAAELAAGAGMSCVYRSMTMFESVKCGQLHQPCNLLAESDGDEELCGVAPAECDEGLSCAQIGDMPQPICVADCTEEADCPLQPLLTCENQLCVLK